MHDGGSQHAKQNDRFIGWGVSVLEGAVLIISSGFLFGHEQRFVPVHDWVSYLTRRFPEL